MSWNVYAVGFIAGVVAYLLGRCVLRLRDIHRAALRIERSENVVRLIQPYAPQFDIDLTEEEAIAERPRHLRAV